MITERAEGRAPDSAAEGNEWRTGTNKGRALVKSRTVNKPQTERESRQAAGALTTDLTTAPYHTSVSRETIYRRALTCESAFHCRALPCECAFV